VTLVKTREKTSFDVSRAQYTLVHSHTVL